MKSVIKQKESLVIGQKVYSKTLDDRRTIIGVVVGYGHERKNGVDVVVELSRTHDGKKFQITTSQWWWEPYTTFGAQWRENNL